MDKLPVAAMNGKELCIKTETEVRAWYSRAEAGTLYPLVIKVEERQMSDELMGLFKN